MVVFTGRGDTYKLRSRRARAYILPCRSLRYTQETCRARFSCGRSLDETTNAIAAGQLNPLTADFLALDVVFLQGVPYSIDNRRLCCLKEAQRRNPWRQIHVRAYVYNIWEVLARFLAHFDTTNDGRWIRIRSAMAFTGVHYSPHFCFKSGRI